MQLYSRGIALDSRLNYKTKGTMTLNEKYVGKKFGHLTIIEVWRDKEKKKQCVNVSVIVETPILLMSEK